MQPLTNVTNLLPKCNNTFHCQRTVDYKNNNNNYYYREKDGGKMHTTLPLLHHTHSVMFNTVYK